MDSSVMASENRSPSMSRDDNKLNLLENNKHKLFEKIVYFASGSIGDDVSLALKSGNAESTCLLSDSVTHCIVGVNFIEADVSAARELYDITTVTPEWIRMSALCNKLLPTKPFNPFEDYLFKGITVCVSQLAANDCKILWALVTFNGGAFTLTLDLNKTTHLVVTKPFGKKYDAVLSNETDKIKIVTPDWVLDCLKNKELCSEISYHPRLLVLPKLPPTNQSFKLQTSGLSTITGFADFDVPIEQPGVALPKNQGLEKLKQRLPWNQPSTPPTSQSVQAPPTPQVSQGTAQLNNTQPKPMMSLMSTPQLQRLSQQQVQQLQLQQQTHASNQLLSQQQMHISQQQNQFQQQIRTQQIQQSKQVQLQHGQQLQFQSNQQHVQQSHIQLQQGQQTHHQIMQKGQQQTLQQNQQHLQMQQKVQQLQSGQQIQNQQQVTLQQQTSQLHQGQQQQQNIQQLQGGQQSTQIPQLQQQTVQIQQGQLQPQTVPIQQSQQQVQMPPLQQQTVQLQQQSGQLSQISKQSVQLQHNQQLPSQLQQGQQIQPQQVQFQTGNSQQVQFPQQQVTQNAQVHIQQSQIQNVQSTQPSQICIVSNGQQIQQAQANPSNQQQLLIQQQQQRLLFQQRIVQQGGGTVSTQWRMAHPSSNVPRVQVNQQPSQQIQQQQTLVIGQQPTVNINSANTQPTTQAQWPQQQTLTIQRTIQQPLDQRQVIWSQQSPHGPQQMIHMDAKTHQQIQAMNPAERLAFINKLTKQRNIVLQQFNARQQQAAGVAAGTNIIRPATPNSQTTVIRTLNHQLISSTGMTQAQQAQWNQIRQQQLIAQQQQQQQQMAGGTVTSGLPTNVKTPNNTLVNNQQVAQPQTTVWQQSTVTEQGHQQTTGSMNAVQLAQLHQRQQQLQQLRLQQLQMDATQKQQAMQQQVVPNQPIVGVMQPNVQSPQVVTTQTSIVQPQQTATLPSNEQCETQTSSQEPFTQMSGQEMSAAGQLRLMTAQHHAAQHQNQQQGSTPGTYQSRTVLNNVTNSASSNRAAHVVGRATAQTVATNKSLPANYNQSAAVRVAAVLAKSAAGQTVGHQQLPHQARFFGHNPNLKLPPDKCLLGCIFLIVEYDRCAETSNDVPAWKQIILDHGGEIEPSYTLRLTHILCQTQKHPLVQQGLRDGKRCITAYWLSDIITKQQLMPPWYALHFPTPYSEERPCRQMLISLTNFEGEERNRVKFMIELTGARVTTYFSADNNILVSKKLEGKKVKKARDTNRPVVNVQWLNEILFGHLSCMYQPENAKYQQFNLNNPFRVDYNLVLHLMGAWKIPINVTQESYDRVRNNPVPVKRKRPRPKFPDFIDQENNDLSQADIIVTNINPPPVDYRPCIMLSGFGLGKEEQRMILQLGGSIAKSYSDATHLVMKESVRTTKFLCCISTVKHIVTAEWLKDSSTQHMFLGEAIYTIEEVSVEQKVICKVHKVLSNPNRHELFKGKIFYVTPGVTNPSVFVVRQIIESAGGTVEKQRRSLRAIQEFEPNTYIIIACNNDLHLVADLIRSCYGIYSSEFVLSAVMTQFINYDMAYKKKMN